MLRRAVFTLAVLALAGCGGAASPGVAPPSRPHVDARPLRLGATQVRLGDATTADDRAGVRELRVGPRRIVPGPPDPRAGRRDGVAAGDGCADRDLLPDGRNTAAVGAATLCLLNAQRLDAGLVPLRASARLAAAAVEHSEDMVARQYFDHTAQDGRDLVDRVRAAGYIDPAQAWLVGENIAWGSGTLGTPASIVAAWMQSPGHRSNLLEPAFREVGVGVAAGSPRAPDMAAAATYTTDFGTIGDPDARPVAVAATAPTRHAGRRKAAGRRRLHARRTGRARGITVGRTAFVKARVALGPKASPPGR